MGHLCFPLLINQPAIFRSCLLSFPYGMTLTGLAACLGGNYGPNPIRPLVYKLIVVDNGSTDGSVEVAKSFEEALTLSEPTPGSYAARNAGLRQARGDYVAFIDSDCVPRETWIEEGVAAASKEPNLGVLAGRVELTYGGSLRISPAVLYERMFSFNQELNAKMGTCVCSKLAEPQKRFGKLRWL